VEDASGSGTGAGMVSFPKWESVGCGVGTLALVEDAVGSGAGKVFFSKWESVGGGVGTLRISFVYFVTS